VTVVASKIAATRCRMIKGISRTPKSVSYTLQKRSRVIQLQSDGALAQGFEPIKYDLPVSRPATRLKPESHIKTISYLGFAVVGIGVGTIQNLEAISAYSQWLSWPMSCRPGHQELVRPRPPTSNLTNNYRPKRPFDVRGYPDPSVGIRRFCWY